MAERQPVAACRFIRREFELIRMMRGAKEDFAAKFPMGYGLRSVTPRGRQRVFMWMYLEHARTASDNCSMPENCGVLP
jgi:hypothetical protein